MEDINAELWTEKYRPNNLDDYVLNSEVKEYFRTMIKNRSVQNLLFSGPAGMGKTTLVKLLASNIGAETLFIPCGVDGTLDVLRTKITEFCNAMTFDGRQKIVILDELDSSSSGSTNNFQMALRNLIEKSSDDTRFLCTCNFSSKILPAVLSRCPLIPLAFDKRDLLVRIKTILDTENIKYTKDSLKAFIEESFGFYPDCRRIINYLQFCCSSGELIVKLNQTVNSARENFLNELLDKVFNCRDILEVRQFYLKNKDKISDFITFSSELFNTVVDRNMLNSDGILKLTDLIYQENVVIDKDIGFFAIVTALKKYGNKQNGV